MSDRPAPPDPVALAVARLDAWLETLRGPGGYGGPVAHWWQQSLLYTGPGLDWRYEGIISGYLLLWQRTGDAGWLGKACRAGDDLLAGQLPNGHFAASCFELNPASAGTPHEAACDVGLLLLARALRAEDRSQKSEVRDQTANETQARRNTVTPDTPTPDTPTNWRRYAEAAERNLQAYYMDKLWDAEAQGLRDDPRVPSFVPNKAATACEAFMLLAEARQDDRWVQQIVLPTLARIVEHQVQAPGPLAGAIAQNSIRGRQVEKYFPKYIARCVPALAAGYRWTGDPRWAEAARQAVQFLQHQARADGSLPTVLYASGRSNCFPSWIAPLADVLWAGRAVQELGLAVDFAAVQARLLAGQHASGGIQTAQGFAAQGGGRPGDLPDVRDVLPVAGWCDKALRALAAQIAGELPQPAGDQRFETDCCLQGQRLRYLETPEMIEISRQGRTRYRWRKGAAWAEVAEPEFWLH